MAFSRLPHVAQRVALIRYNEVAGLLRYLSTSAVQQNAPNRAQGNGDSFKHRKQAHDTRRRGAVGKGRKDSDFLNLGHICRAFKDATTRGDDEQAMSLLERYHEAGGEKQLWMFDMLINMHGRKRNLAGALSVRDLMHECGVKGSTHVYSSLLVACAHSKGTGYNLPPSTVAAAEQLLAEMDEHGIARDFAVHSISLDVYAKAGMLARVQDILKEMETSRMRPGLREYTSLLDACKRAAQPALATHVMYHTLPAAGLVPDSQAWNALLGAYGRNGDMDNAYATWQEMMKRRVLPTEVTERELAEAFSSSPGFAADLMQQCRRFRSVLQATDTPMHAPPSHGSDHETVPTILKCCIRGHILQELKRLNAHASQHRTLSVEPATGASSALLIGAFHLGGWLNWLRTGLHYPASASPSTPRHTTNPRTTPRNSTGTSTHTAQDPSSPATAAAVAVMGVGGQSANDSVAESNANVDNDMSAQTYTTQGLQEAASGRKEDTRPTRPSKLDVHRMNSSQARIAVLQRLSLLVAELPRAEVEVTKRHMELGEMKLFDSAAERDAHSRTGLQREASERIQNAEAAGRIRSTEDSSWSSEVPVDTPTSRSQPAADTAVLASDTHGTMRLPTHQVSGNGDMPIADQATCSTASHRTNKSVDIHSQASSSQAASPSQRDVWSMGNQEEDARLKTDRVSGAAAPAITPVKISGSTQEDAWTGELIMSSAGPSTSNIMHMRQSSTPRLNVSTSAHRAALEEAGGLQVVVGRGRHGGMATASSSTALDSNALRKVVEEVCFSVRVECEEVPGNPGRLHITQSEILRFAARSDFHGERHALISRVVFRMTLLVVAAGGLFGSLTDPTWHRWSEFVMERFPL